MNYSISSQRLTEYNNDYTLLFALVLFSTLSKPDRQTLKVKQREEVVQTLCIFYQ